MASTPPLSLTGKLIAAWGVVGVVVLLAQAIVRLTPIAVEAMSMDLALFQWAILAAWVVINAFAEGYRGFQKAFSPRVVARAVHLGHHPTFAAVVLAPVYCMAMFHAKRKNLIVAWTLLIGIVLLVAAVRMLPQPWRGIVDAGVVAGLAWGTLSLIVIFVRALGWNEVPADDSLPD